MEPETLEWHHRSSFYLFIKRRAISESLLNVAFLQLSSLNWSCRTPRGRYRRLQMYAKPFKCETQTQSSFKCLGSYWSSRGQKTQFSYSSTNIQPRILVWLSHVHQLLRLHHLPLVYAAHTHSGNEFRRCLFFYFISCNVLLTIQKFEKQH